MSNDRAKAALAAMGERTDVNPQGFKVTITDLTITDRGVAWSAKIYHGDTLIGRAENTGRGGQTQVRINDATMFAVYRAAARAACPDSYEAPSRFAEILATYDEVGYQYVP